MQEQAISWGERYLFTSPGKVYLRIVRIPVRNCLKSYSLELTQDDIGYVIRRSWGRIGKKLQSLQHNHALLLNALREANSKYREKLRKGYMQKDHPAEEKMHFWS
jgi:predicted DNA-binding WGR domain protein